MKNGKNLWLKLYLHGHPWFLDLDQKVLIDCLNMENMRFGFSDGEADGFCFLYPNPHSLEDDNMLVRVIRHTLGMGDDRETWFELKTQIGNTESVRTINECGAYREQEFVLFHADQRSSVTDHGDRPFFGMATFENSPMLEDPALFEIDFKNFALIDMENPENIIPVTAMHDTGKGYAFYYDPVRKNIVELSGDFHSGTAEPYLVRFNYLVRLHPRAVSICHDIPVGLINAQTDREFMDELRKAKRMNERRKPLSIAWRKKLQRTLRTFLS
ncbi:MAG: hypothetical protein KF704_02015 [Crocinitomicaceae bacterium]|nr:hypothetical protein [Crocinitomicaceae bacterium]